MDDTVGKGSIVLSKSGRDKGRYFFVLNIIDKEYLLLADGRIRTIEQPKKKKYKHCSVFSKTGDKKISEKLENGCKIENAELRKSLKLFLSEEVI